MSLIGRTIERLRRFGLRQAIARASRRLKHDLFQNRRILFCRAARAQAESGGSGRYPVLVVDAYNSMAELPSADFRQLANHAGEVSLGDEFQRFFRRGAVLWTARLGNHMVGWMWSKMGGLDRFDAIPIAREETVIMAVHVLPDFRGQRIAPAMLEAAMNRMAEASVSRVLLCVRVWNSPMLRTVGRMGFERLGVCRELRGLGRRLTIWRVKDLPH